MRGPVLVLYKVELHQCLGSPGNTIRNMQYASMHDGVFLLCVCLCFVACVWLHTFPSLLPSLHACMHTLHARIHYIMHTYITCTHTYAYACIQIHAPDIQHIHRHTVHIYTYLHISIYSTSIYIHIHAYVCAIYLYVYMDHKDLHIYSYRSMCACQWPQKAVRSYIRSVQFA